MGARFKGFTRRAGGTYDGASYGVAEVAESEMMLDLDAGIVSRRAVFSRFGQPSRIETMTQGIRQDLSDPSLQPGFLG